MTDSIPSSRRRLPACAPRCRGVAILPLCGGGAVGHTGGLDGPAKRPDAGAGVGHVGHRVRRGGAAGGDGHDQGRRRAAGDPAVDLFVTAQHFLYALRLRERIAPLPLRWRLTTGFLLTDELFALIGEQAPARFDRWYALGAGLTFTCAGFSPRCSAS